MGTGNLKIFIQGYNILLYGQKYWIPNLDLYIKELSKSGTSLVKYHENNVVEIETPEDIQEILNAIRNYERVKDEEIQQFFNNNFPNIEISTVPINLEELKSAFRSIFSELPEEFFEEVDAAKLLTKALNFYFIKKETQFIIFNIMAGKLEYKPDYRHPPTIEFYFRMQKTAYDLEEYYQTLRDAQRYIQRAILTEIFYNNEKKNIDRAQLSMIERGLNISGGFFVQLDGKLDNFMTELENTRRFVKRTIIPLPDDYGAVEAEAVQKINETKNDVQERLKKINEAKAIIRRELQERKGILTLENAKYLVELIVEFLF